MSKRVPLPFRSYEGDEPYIFVSYSHRDSDLVFPIIGRLNDAGYRVWYDEGIDPGTEWPEEIAMHLKNSTTFLLFVSPDAMDSQNVRREINMAISRKKHLVCVYLKQTELSEGMEMQLSLIQSIYYSYPETEDFYDRLQKVLGKAMREISSQLPEQKEAAQSKKKQERFIKKHTKWFVAAAIALTLTLFLIFILPGIFNSDVPPSEPSPSTPLSQTPSAPAESDMTAPGNSGFNIANGGWVAQQGNYMVFVYGEYDNSVYRCKSDWSDVQILLNESVSCLNIQGDWVYYLDSNAREFRRISTDGTKSPFAIKLYGTAATVLGEYVYYINWSNESICKARLDDGEETVLADVYSERVYVDGDWVYFDDYRGDSGIYRVRTDGTDNEKYITNRNAIRHYYVDSGYLYYFTTANTFVRKNLQTGELESLPEINTDNYHVYGDLLYYFKQKTGENGISTTELIELTMPNGAERVLTEFNFEVHSISLTSEWLYIASPVGRYRVSREGGLPERMSNYLLSLYENPDLSALPPLEDADSVKNEIDSSVANQLQSGMAASQGESAYYSSGFYAAGLTRLKDGLKTVICDDVVNSICVSGDWVYFSNISHSSLLYKVRVDGKGLTRLSEDYASQIQIYGDWVYYLNENEGRCVYRIHPDGTGRMKVSQSPAYTFSVIAGKLIYSNNADGRRLYSANLDGSDNKRLAEEYSFETLAVEGDYIYYYAYNAKKLGRMKLDGTEQEYLADGEFNRLNAVSGWVYFVFGESDALYRTSAENNWQQEEVFPGPVGLLNITGDWVYFMSSGTYYRMPIAGGEIEALG